MSINFQDEAEVKEYLQNIGIEYRFGCYSEKKPEVCELLGDYFESVKRDWVNARKIYRNSCNEYSHGKSCFKYGNYALMGRGNEESNPPEALKAFEKGCTSDDQDTCFSAGLLYFGERPIQNMKMGIQTDIAKGFEYITKACKLNNPNACYYLSRSYASGVQEQPPKNTEKIGDGATKVDAEKPKKPFAVEKDMKKAFDLALKACQLKHMPACASLRYMYARGEGTEKNEELAKKYRDIVMNYQDEHTNYRNPLVFQQTK